MRRILLTLLMLLVPALAMAQSLTVTWGTPTSKADNSAMTAEDQAAVITVIETGTLAEPTSTDVSWAEVGRSAAGATTWKGTAPDGFVGVRAKHILNGAAGNYSKIFLPGQPKSTCVVVEDDE